MIFNKFHFLFSLLYTSIIQITSLYFDSLKTKLAQKIVTGWIVGLQGMVEKNEFKLICNRKSDYLTKKRTKMIKTEKSKSYCSLSVQCCP